MGWLNWNIAADTIGAPTSSWWTCACPTSPAKWPPNWCWNNGSRIHHGSPTSPPMSSASTAIAKAPRSRLPQQPDPQRGPHHPHPRGALATEKPPRKAFGTRL